MKTPRKKFVPKENSAIFISTFFSEFAQNYRRAKSPPFDIYTGIYTPIKGSLF